MRKRTIIGILCAVLLAATAIICLIASRYTLVDFRLYPKNAQSLDLRGETIHPEVYEKLTEKLPDTDIQFEFAFQGGVLDGGTTEVTIESLTVEEAEVLASLPRLRSVRAEECRDFEALLHLKQLRPDVQVTYHVPIGGTAFSSTAVQLNLGGIAEEEISLIQYLPYVKTVTVFGGEPEILSRLRAYCTNAGIVFRIRVAGNILSEETEELTLHGAENADIALLHLAPWLKKIHIAEPLADGDQLTALAAALPGTDVTWEKTVFGLTFSQDATEIDLTPVIALDTGESLGDKTAYQYGAEYPVLGTKEEIPSSIKVLKYHPLPDKVDITNDLIAEVEAAMDYFPQAEKLVMCGSRLNNVAMSDFRERHRDDYKVVWMVQCGEIATRTDATFFMPTKYHVYYFKDPQMADLRYCEDLVTIDIGHMKITDISFVEYMPHLRYLIITLTLVKDISPLASCKELVFLEMDWSCVSDYSPLVNCTALEDLNIGETFGDITPICQMTWLKNLWIVGCGISKYYDVAKALPQTNIGVFYENPDDGWRKLPNYYIMRDNLLMFYML